ncbi:hypothetical protein IEO21_03865 [Rhodonia placenta]|uniref:Uncharacterized protein n=1 Tax=Rhodonia placenta TaxID=104341 RepID=A0A8H7P4U6_9APHY|nr:hypothetical protein IEO21_03865 [Postia placenta]
MPSLNFAHAEGIYSLAGAIIFAVAYLPLLLTFLYRSIRLPTFVHFILTLFCSVRTIAFILRAVLAGSYLAAQNKNLVIAEQVIYSVSFSGMLYSAYTLVLDREAMVDVATLIQNNVPVPLKILFRLLRMRMLIRLILVLAIVLGIIGAVDSETTTSSSKYNKGIKLRSDSVYIFLAVVCALNVNTFMFSAATIMGYSQKPPGIQPVGLRRIGTTYGIFILLAIAILLLTREAFYAGTESDLSKQNDEKLWYPLSALTEYVAAALFLIPGLPHGAKGDTCAGTHQLKAGRSLEESGKDVNNSYVWKIVNVVYADEDRIHLLSPDMVFTVSDDAHDRQDYGAPKAATKTRSESAQRKAVGTLTGPAQEMLGIGVSMTFCASLDCNMNEASLRTPKGCRNELQAYI